MIVTEANRQGKYAVDVSNHIDRYRFRSKDVTYSLASDLAENLTMTFRHLFRKAKVQEGNVHPKPGDIEISVVNINANGHEKTVRHIIICEE